LNKQPNKIGKIPSLRDEMGILPDKISGEDETNPKLIILSSKIQVPIYFFLNIA